MAGVLVQQHLVQQVLDIMLQQTWLFQTHGDHGDVGAKLVLQTEGQLETALVVRVHDARHAVADQGGDGKPDAYGDAHDGCHLGKREVHRVGVHLVHEVARLIIIAVAEVVDQSDEDPNHP